jgi:hypothetical protein
MIILICLMFAFNLVPIIFDLVHIIKLSFVKIYHIEMRWLLKNCLGETFKKELSLHDLIKLEKEEILKEIENP